MAKVLLSALLFGLLLFVADASRNTQLTGRESDVTYVVEGPRDGNEAADLNVVIQSTPNHGLQDTFCCLSNAFGCLQNCDSNIKYYCCLKNGFGSCLQLCDSSKEHYCCKKNGFEVCVGMCPKTVDLMK
ncbi:hypothetical protein SELMODRAFT_438130 [Selaginella moellendorffii]|uniref:Uncharacterized protein n=1 Tax=Selaginella moellendorffii TaxID=88036 RepID=D8QUB3_SELML|nr:uncharacterized protein LOC9661802 [Selaginella moellendorffii]EFJ35840.1 hypothetical protein SELMODRAFT_438130 [Selaginella moellendorffii]|eukprot:XP_002962377.1 uncharacterized protein LOC9661802 [Selaginella moellendorffii]